MPIKYWKGWPGNAQFVREYPDFNHLMFEVLDDDSMIPGIMLDTDTGKAELLGEFHLHRNSDFSWATVLIEDGGTDEFWTTEPVAVEAAVERNKAGKEVVVAPVAPAWKCAFCDQEVEYPVVKLVDPKSRKGYRFAHLKCADWNGVPDNERERFAYGEDDQKRETKCLKCHTKVTVFEASPKDRRYHWWCLA